MNQAIQAYPLSWPTGWKRTERADQKIGKFRTGKSGSSWLTISQAVDRVLDEMRRMEISREDLIISTNCKTNIHGLPRGDSTQPVDVGVAIYWQKEDGVRQCMAIDIYAHVQGPCHSG